jgi:hypothetical protein
MCYLILLITHVFVKRAAKEDKKRLERKKALSEKKNFRRNRKSWD